MFLVCEISGSLFATNLNSVSRLSVNGNSIQDYQLSTRFVIADSVEEATKRFDDIIDAFSNDQKVYDARKEVGYWKAKKPGPKAKPKAQAPAQGNQEPAPKK